MNEVKRPARAFELIKKISAEAREFWRANPFWSSVTVFLLLFFLLSIFYLSKDGVSALDDHFFLFRYAELLRERGWIAVQDFQWIYFSKTARENTLFPASLFHVALIPFTFFKDKIFGLKVSDIFWFSLSLSFFYYVLRKMKINFALFAIFFLLSIDVFYQRMLMGRAYILIVSLVFLEIYLAVRKEHKKFFLASLFHIFWHPTTFFLPLIISAIVEASRSIRIRKTHYQNVLAAFLSFLLASLFQYIFLGNMWTFLNSIFKSQKNLITSERMRAVEGLELLRRPISSLLDESQILFLILIAGLTFVIFFYLVFKKEEFREVSEAESGKGLVNKNIESDILMYAVFLFTLVSLGGTVLVSGRFSDFYFPSSLLLGILVFLKLKSGGYVSCGKSAQKIAVAALAIFLVFACDNAVLNGMKVASRNDYRPYAEISEWIGKNSQKEELVFLRDWDNFPPLFFFNPENNYTMGMEPINLYEYDPKLFWKWYNIYLGNYYCARPEDCLGDRDAVYESFAKDESKKDLFFKQNSLNIIKSVKNDFKSKIVVSNSFSFNEMIEKNSDLIEDSFEAKSGNTGEILKVYKLK